MTPSSPIRRHLVVSFAVLSTALVLGACGGPTPAAQTSSSTGTTGSSSTSSSRTGGTADPGATRGSGSTSPSGRSSSAAQAGPSPVQLPWTPSSDVPVTASLSPRCFRPGALVTLTVHTRPKAGVAYIANYSDNGNGEPKPYGSGYGGNDKGYSTADGDYTSAWRVSTDAPAGPGRVDVIVGWNSEWGYAGPAFTVAGPGYTC